MVDVDSALRASAYSGRKNKSDSKDGEKPASIEPFDPAAHAIKEKADAISMWTVIALGVLVAFLMRYQMMTRLEGPQQVLWLLPLLGTLAIPSIHRLVVPSEFFELYTGGNWFRASFLYLFTWLALSFALVNPPMADVAAPHLAGAIDVEANDGISLTSLDGSTYNIEIVQDQVPVVIGLAVRDNVNATNAQMSMTITKKGIEEPIISASGTVSDIANSGPGEDFQSVQEWSRGMHWNALMKFHTDHPKVAPNGQDIGMAWNLCEGGCEPGIFTISIELSEDSSVWSNGLNTWSQEYTVRISQVG
ncbi:MAG: hypothetical protein CMA87_03240 [Euryarchaeota archaeon]|nr:hypothetical protein [Euryarchaeota archaeon]